MRVNILCADGIHYLRVFRDGSIDAQATVASTWETFEFEEHADQRFSLRTLGSHPQPNQYLRAQAGGGGDLSADRDVPNDHEKFGKLALGGGKLAIRTRNGSYWRAKHKGGAELDCRATVPDLWEVFTIQVV